MFVNGSKNALLSEVNMFNAVLIERDPPPSAQAYSFSMKRNCRRAMSRCASIILSEEIPLSQAIERAASVLGGQIRGRLVVNPNA
jgi:hypothetical protein